MLKRHDCNYNFRTYLTDSQDLLGEDAGEEEQQASSSSFDDDEPKLTTFHCPDCRMKSWCKGKFEVVDNKVLLDVLC